MLFGASVLGRPDVDNRLARTALTALNRRGIFSNLGDTETGLEDLLRKAFVEVAVERIGAVTVFTARRPQRQTRGS